MPGDFRRTREQPGTKEFTAAPLPPDAGKPQSRSPRLSANTALVQPPVLSPPGSQASPPRPQGAHLPLQPPFLEHPKAYFMCLTGHSPNLIPWSTHQKCPFIFPHPREHTNNYPPHPPRGILLRVKFKTPLKVSLGVSVVVPNMPMLICHHT